MNLLTPKFVAGILLASVLTGCNQESELAEAETAISQESISGHIQVLASDQFGGRAPFSEGEARTLGYLVDKIERMGLSPANDGSFLQEVPLFSTTITSTPILTVDGNSKTQTFSATGSVSVRNPIDTSKVELDGVEIVFAGYGIDAPEFGWNDYASLDVEGKLVIVLVNDPGFATQDPELFSGNSMTWYGRWPYKYDVAAKYGAVGVLVVHETDKAGYPWESIANSVSLPNFVIDQGSTAPKPSLEGWITDDAIRKIFAQAGLDFDEMAEKASRKGFVGTTLGLSGNLSFSTKVDRQSSNNVIAMLPGRERPDEVILYTAHWDHIGTDHTQTEGDNIYNGAIDNASGVAGILSIAEAFSKLQQPPERTIAFLFVTAEEKGLLGARYYAGNPVFPLNKTIANFNVDVINWMGTTSDITVIGVGRSELDDFLRARIGHREVVGDPTPERGFYYRSDHFELAKVGVPALFFNTGRNLVGQEAGVGQAMYQDFYSNRYHRPNDEFDPTWDLSGAVDDMRLMFRIGYDLGNSSAVPNWHPGNEFRATRDSSFLQAQ